MGDTQKDSPKALGLCDGEGIDGLKKAELELSIVGIIRVSRDQQAHLEEQKMGEGAVQKGQRGRIVGFCRD